MQSLTGSKKNIQRGEKENSNNKDFQINTLKILGMSRLLYSNYSIISGSYYAYPKHNVN